MKRKIYQQRRIRPNRWRHHPSVVSQPNQAEPFYPAGDMPAWRSLLRFLVLGFLAVGAIYLSAVSVNVLILGTDDVDYSKHTDTIMLVHWQPLPRRLALLSIPRDTLIHLPKRGPMKINAVYAYGNALGNRTYALAMTRACLENLLGLHVHYVIHIRYTSFIKLVDALGGVPMYVPKRLRYVDHAGGVNIDLEPGYQLLDGRQALNYVRFRHDQEGDLGRIRRQQLFVQAFITQLARFSQLPRTFHAFYTFINQVETNLNLPAALFLAMEIKSVAGKSWRQGILPGEAVYIQGRSFWKPDLKRIRQMVADLGRPAASQSPVPRATVSATEPLASPDTEGVSEEPPRLQATPRPQPTAQPRPVQIQQPLPRGAQPVIRVLNGCGVPGVAARVQARLQQNRLRIDNDKVTNAPAFDFTQTIIKSKSKDLPWARRIATILGLDEDRIQVIPANIAYPTVTIVIGNDYRELVPE